MRWSVIAGVSPCVIILMHRHHHVGEALVHGASRGIRILTSVIFDGDKFIEMGFPDPLALVSRRAEWGTTSFAIGNISIHRKLINPYRSFYCFKTTQGGLFSFTWRPLRGHDGIERQD